MLIGRLLHPYGSRTRTEGGEGEIAGDSAVDLQDGGTGGAVGSSIAGAAAAPNEDSGGGDTQGAALLVLSTTPSDGAAGVERDVAIEVTFSVELDPDSVTPSNFTVVGSNGVVPGKLEVSGDTVTFKADAAWSLMADYTIEISPQVTGSDGSELDGAYRYGFQTRDGAFGAPERVSTVSNIELGLTGNASGSVAVSWRTPVTAIAEAAIYDPVSARWGVSSALDTDTSHTYDSPCLALNEPGDAFAALAGSAGLWRNRYNGGKWGAAKPEGSDKSYPFCALADDGTAMMTWLEYVGSETNVLAASLSTQDVWSQPTVLQTNAKTWVVRRSGAGLLAIIERAANGGVYSIYFDPKTGAGEPKLIKTGAINVVNLETFDSSALFTWNVESLVEASLFDGHAWTTKELGPGAGGTGLGLGASGHIVVWYNQSNTYAARYDLRAGWGDPVQLGATTSTYPGPAGGIDPAGNAIAAWPSGSDVAWRRSVHGAEKWAAIQRIPNQDPNVVSARVDDAGDVMLVWVNALGVWASRFE